MVFSNSWQHFDSIGFETMKSLLTTNFMKTQFNKRIILFALLVSSATAAMAQDTLSMSNVDKKLPVFSKSSSYRTWSVGVNGGVLMPLTPVTLKHDFSDYNHTLGYGGYIKKQLGHVMGLQADFLKGILRGNNGNNTFTTYKSYETKLDWSAALSANFILGNISFLHEKSYIQPYANVGGGVISYTNTTVNQANVSSESTKQDQRNFFIPIALGTKIALGRAVNFDLGYRASFVDTDMLDGYEAGSTNDKFGYGYAGLEFSLGNLAKPQLAAHNPVADMRNEYIAKYDDLKAQLDAEKANMAAEHAKLTADADMDGVSDYFDKCPNTPSGTKVDGSGCTLPSFTKPADVKVYVTEEDKKVVTDAIKNLEFDLGKSTIRSTSFESLNRVADLLVSKNFSLKLAGHTDHVGSNESNLKLSKDRAESVKTYLVSKGANPSRIEATGYGESQPIDTNNTTLGRQNNRRVEFTLY